MLYQAEETQQADGRIRTYSSEQMVGGQNTPSNAPAPRMSVVVNALETQIFSVAERLDELEKRLSRVTYSEPVESDRTEGRKIPPHGYCDNIESQIIELEKIKQKLGNIIDHLEV